MHKMIWKLIRLLLIILLQLRLALGEFLRNRSGDPSTGAKPASSMDIKRSCMKILSILVPQDKKNIASDALNSSK